MNFSSILLQWYAQNKRDLPWRDSDNPYVIWIAEVVFQQTRIEQGLPFFIRFIQKFPSVDVLARAKEESVLKMWQGLGYYSRARNLHFSAKYIVNELQGFFPTTYNELLKLKGVGPYIAAEVASVCSNEVIAAIDGNVQRVISRYYGVREAVNSPVGEKAVRALANEHISTTHPGDFNQALMDFGSSMCTPKSPNCENCVFNESCWAFRNDEVANIPLKINKVKVRKRFFNFLLVRKGNAVAMQKRGPGDVWQGLYQPLLFESKVEMKSLEMEFSEGYLLKEGIRQLSHQKLHLKFWAVSNLEIANFEDVEWISISDLHLLPVSKSIEQLFSSNEFQKLVT